MDIVFSPSHFDYFGARMVSGQIGDKELLSGLLAERGREEDALQDEGMGCLRKRFAARSRLERISKRLDVLIKRMEG